jgi:hypothetical protein
MPQRSKQRGKHEARSQQRRTGTSSPTDVRVWFDSSDPEEITETPEEFEAAAVAMKPEPPREPTEADAYRRMWGCDPPAA